MMMDTQIIYVYDELNKLFEESYNTLRENIRFCNTNKDIKTIAITSSKPKEGKTTIAINFAVSLANASYSVLLLDADLRKLKVNKHLGKDTSIGITDYINDNIDPVESIVYKTSIENLYYVSGGSDTHKPSEILGSLRFKELLLKLRDIYDYVIIDTPPICSVIDGSIVASLADRTVLVVETGVVEREVAERTRTQLSDANANILGVVLNRINKWDYKKFYRYYNYFWDKKNKLKQKRKNIETRKV
jgi:protein-tyrosine kinase